MNDAVFEHGDSKLVSGGTLTRGGPMQEILLIAPQEELKDF